MVTTSGTCDLPGVARLLGRVSRGRALLLVVVVVLGLAVGVIGSPRAPSKAVEGIVAPGNPGQVRILQEGNYVGGGTLVASDWVFTTGSLFTRPGHLSIYSVRFGATSSSQDNAANLRSVSRLVFAPPELGDGVLVQLSEPVSGRPTFLSPPRRRNATQRQACMGGDRAGPS
jgi:hypothetical protein